VNFLRGATHIPKYFLLIGSGIDGAGFLAAFLGGSKNFTSTSLPYGFVTSPNASSTPFWSLTSTIAPSVRQQKDKMPTSSMLKDKMPPRTFWYVVLVAQSFSGVHGKKFLWRERFCPDTQIHTLICMRAFTQNN
jgi:hypothetical protein